MYRLVIIDDEYYTLEGMREIIDWDKYDITVSGTASDGLEGMALVNEVNADIVIADICMQGMDGLEMIERLRKNGFRGKVIILSGYQTFEYAQRSIDLKVEKYLTKPINPEELEITISKIVDELNEERGGVFMQLTPELFEKIKQYVDDNYTKDVRLSALAEQFYCSTPYISKAFKKYTGMNFIDYITKKRIDRAKELLVHSGIPIDEIIGHIGYQDAKHFRMLFKRQEGISPSEYRKKKQ